MKKTAAIVVTYNRKQLLQECIASIHAQTHPVERILIINNHSTDGTETLFEPGQPLYSEINELHTMSENLGGAGGFYEGMRLAAMQDYDYVWIMDDDSIPEPTALEELFQAENVLCNEKPGFLASAVFGPNGEAMNVPVIQLKKSENGYSDWYRYLNEGIVKIRHATFVSLLIPTAAIRQIGLPIRDYFIWGDDTEYTQRLGKYYGEGYFCGRSKVIHKRANTKNVSIFEEDNPVRIDNYRYFYRNSLINAKQYNPPGNSALHTIQFFGDSFSCLLKKDVSHRFRKFITIQKAVWEYLLDSRDIRSQIEENIHKTI